MQASVIRVAIFVAMVALSASVLSDPPVKQKREKKIEETPVFITGSLIPKRLKLHPTGTKTVSPVRITDRVEIDKNGRPTTPGALANDPSVQVTGH